MAVLCLLLCIVCLFDYSRGKIPNLFVILIGFMGIGRSFWETGPAGMVFFLAKAAGVILLFYPFFRIGTLGAGDVKLLGVTAGFFSRKIIFHFLFFSMLIAAVFSVLRVIRERNAKERLHYFCEYCADVICTGNWRSYLSDNGRKFKGICLSGPVLCSVLLHWGGVY